MEVPELYQWLANRFVANLPNNTEALAYLRRNGITNEDIWQRYKIGVGDADLIGALDDAGRDRLHQIGLLPKRGPSEKVLSGSGVFIPTFHPSNLNQPVGLIKLTWAQNKHHLVTEPPAGIACTADVTDASRVIIIDTPFLALRLTQAGAKGVVIAETASVLPPLREWLAGREIILASYRHVFLDSFKEAIGADLAAKAVVVQVHTELELSNETILTQLGLPSLRVNTIPPLLIAQISHYAGSRIAEGHGIDLLRRVEADNQEFVEAYQLGFLPEDFLSALPTDAKRMLRGRLAGPSIMAPAFDDTGAPVDILNLKPVKMPVQRNLNDTITGLIAPKVASSNRDVLLCDTLTAAARLWQHGHRNVLLLRGEVDAKNNAVRLLDSGVRTAKIVAWKGDDAEQTAAALRAAQIEVEIEIKRLPKLAADNAGVDDAAPTPESDTTEEQESISSAKTTVLPVDFTPAASTEQDAPTETPAVAVESPADPEPGDIKHFDYPDRPTLISHDERTMRARFQAGDVLYEVETALDCSSKLEVTVQRDGQKHRDRFDLSRAAQRKRFAESAALKAKVPFEVVEAHLIHLLDDVRAIQEDILEPKTQKLVPAAAMTDEEKSETLALLRNPNLLDIISTDLEALGIVGERRNALLLYMVATSRLLPFHPPLSPLSTALISSSSAGKTFTVETVLAAMPMETILHVSKLSDNAMFYLDRNALSHRILVLPESDILTKDIAVTLRILLSNGALTHSHVQRDNSTGSARSQIAEAKGPVSLMTTTTGGLDDQVLSRCVEIRLDESSEQSKRITSKQLTLRSDPEHASRREKTIRRHHCLQRMLQSHAVLIPFASRIEFDASRVQHRRLLDKFLNLTAAVALLMQHQRPKDGNMIVASERDFTVAVELFADVIGCASDELSGNARDVLALVQAEQLCNFNINELKAKRPGWTRHKFRAGLDELLAVEVLVSPKRSRPRRYEVVLSAIETLSAPAVRLRAGDVATSGENGITDTTQRAATG